MTVKRIREYLVDCVGYSEDEINEHVENGGAEIDLVDNLVELEKWSK